MRLAGLWLVGVKLSLGAEEEEEDESIISNGSLFEDSSCIGEGGAAGGWLDVVVQDQGEPYTGVLLEMEQLDEKGG